MGAVLIDRYNRHNCVAVPKVGSLTELAELVVAEQE